MLKRIDCRAIESSPGNVVAKPKRADTTVPPISGSFEDAVRALLKTPPAPKNLGRPKTKKATAKKR
jgi:hypothetical protein